MDVEKINITDIVPADYNPRVMSEEEFNHLRNSIDEFGLVDPIIINLKNNHIIGGHQRYDVLMEKYEEELADFEFNLIRLGNVGWVFTEDNLDVKDDNYEKALNVALNKISGMWDEDKLLNLFESLDEDDIHLSGFEEEDIYDIELNYLDTQFDNIEEVGNQIIPDSHSVPTLYWTLKFSSKEDEKLWLDFLDYLTQEYHEIQNISSKIIYVFNDFLNKE